MKLKRSSNLQHVEGIYENERLYEGRALIWPVQNGAFATSALWLDKEVQERKGVSVKQQAMISSHVKEGLPRSKPRSGDICQLDECLGVLPDSRQILVGAQYATAKPRYRCHQAAAISR